jgi:hypothetical protein
VIRPWISQQQAYALLHELAEAHLEITMLRAAIRTDHETRIAARRGPELEQEDHDRRIERMVEPYNA